MICGACGHPSHEGTRFCGACGARLDVLTSAESSVPAMLGDRYRVVEQIGGGLRKTVYRAHDNLLDRDVALAVLRVHELDDAERARAEREVRALARLGSHPNIVTLYDVEN